MSGILGLSTADSLLAEWRFFADPSIDHNSCIQETSLSMPCQPTVTDESPVTYQLGNLGYSMEAAARLKDRLIEWIDLTEVVCKQVFSSIESEKKA